MPDFSKECDSQDTSLLYHCVTSNNPSNIFRISCLFLNEELISSNSSLYKLQNYLIIFDSKLDNLTYGLVSFQFIATFRHLAEATK